MAKENNETQIASFAAGCFWGIEEAFNGLKGVTDTTVGYSGGTLDNPTYEQVSSGKTRHTETVEVTYNPKLISYEQLLSAFWQVHDPTTMNRQGPDVGSQYRSVIFYHSPEQKEVAEKSKKEMDASGKFKNPIVSDIVEATPFYRAEEYHQKYWIKNPGTTHCPTPKIS